MIAEFDQCERFNRYRSRFTNKLTHSEMDVAALEW